MVMFKKMIFIAGLAVTAAACTKVMPASGLQSESQISFQPLVANATKADYVSDATISGHEAVFNFSVYAWYTPGVSFNAENAQEYMVNVPVIWNETLGAEPDGNGSWAPEETYYWPKNGKLSFEAYYPTGKAGTVSSSKDKGLEFKDFAVPTLNEQYDLLYSERVFDKTSSVGADGGYAGVDIPFKHALSAVEVTAKADADYSGALKLKKITILNVYNKGTFNQNLAAGQETDKMAWTEFSGKEDYVLFDSSDGVVLTTVALSSSSAENKISNAILLPQVFAHLTSEHVSIKVEYSIKHGTNWLDQENTFDLADGYSGISAWEMGRKYTYNFTIALDKVYFAPGVEDWKDVAVNPITVK